MLDRIKVMKECNAMMDTLFIDMQPEINEASHWWERIIADQLFHEKVRQSRTDLLVPSWEQPLGRKVVVTESIQEYAVCSVDGSQIYPDRHHGLNCFLINSGTVVLQYGTIPYRALLTTEPAIFTAASFEYTIDLSHDLVNAMRQELELFYGLQIMRKTYSVEPVVLLLDGSLIFWHIDQQTDIQNIFLPRYLELLNEMHSSFLLVASYISSPRSKELVNLIRLAKLNFDTHSKDARKEFRFCTDATLMHHFLSYGARSIIFKSNAHITKKYESYIAPYFFYMHCGDEIARVEIPAWIAHDENKVNTVMQCILDQVEKGYGYPIALAEAHEQAVVKGVDREFFITLLQHYAIDYKKNFHISKKLYKKRHAQI